MKQSDGITSDYDDFGVFCETSQLVTSGTGTSDHVSFLNIMDSSCSRTVLSTVPV